MKPVLALHHFFRLLLFYLPQTLFAEEILLANVNENDGFFIVKLEMTIDASDDDVYDILTDYTQLTTLSDSIVSSRILQTTPDYTLLQVNSRGCVLLFCVDLSQTQKVTEPGDGSIIVEDIPARSDFAYGKSVWRITADDDATLIRYHARFKPDFWLPPLLGDWIFKERLLEEAKSMITRVEQRLNND